VGFSEFPELMNSVRNEHLHVGRNLKKKTKLNKFRRLVTGVVVITLCVFFMYFDMKFY
jgi:hypothetical protein